jgi:hypothetical protein
MNQGLTFAGHTPKQEPSAQVEEETQQPGRLRSLVNRIGVLNRVE